MTSPHPNLSKCSCSKKIALTGCGILAILGIGIGSLPWVLSTSRGTAWLSRQITQRTGVELSIGSASFSWFGSQRLFHLKAESKEELAQLSCPEITTSASLWNLLGNHDIGVLLLKSPHLILSKPFLPSASLKRPSLQAAGLAPRVQLGLALQGFSWTGDAHIEEGQISFLNPHLDPVSFEKIRVDIRLLGAKGVEGSLQCVAIQNAEEGSLSLEASLAQTGDCTAHAAIQKLPTRGIDQLIGLIEPHYSGLFYSLVGSTLDLTCSLQTLAESAHLQLDAASPLIHIHLAAQSLDHVLHLVSPAQVALQLTPALVEKLGKRIPSLGALSLTDPTTLQATIQDYTSPFPFTQAGLQEASFQVDLSLSPDTKGSCNNQPLVIKTLEFHAHSPSLQEQLLWTGSCEMALGELTGSLATQGSLSYPLSEQQRQGEIAVTASQFPLLLFHETEWLGSTADMTSTLTYQKQNAQLVFSWNSPLLQIPSLHLSLTNDWKLNTPAAFTYTPPAFLTNGTEGMISQLTPIQGSLQRLEVPSGQWQQMDLEASAHTDTLSIRTPLDQTLSDIHLALSVHTLNQIAVQLKSAELNASMSGLVNVQQGTFSLSQPLVAQYTMTLPQLAKPTHLQLALDPLTFSLADPLAHGVKGQLFCPEAAFQMAEQPILLHNTVLPFQWDEKAQRLNLQLSSQAKGTGAETGSIQGQLNCSPQKVGDKLTLSSAALQGSLRLDNLSSEWIDILLERPDLSLLLGSTFNAHIQLNRSSAEHTFSMHWSSPNLGCDASFLFNPTGLHLQSPAPIQIRLTPESYRVLDRLLTQTRQTAFGLNAPSQFTLTLSKLFLPFVSTQQGDDIATRFFPLSLDTDSLELVLSGTNPELSFVDKASKEIISLTQLSGSIHKLSGQTPITLTLDSAVSTQNGQNAKSGSLTASATIDLPQDKNLAVDLSKLSMLIDLQAKQFPCRALDIFARASGRTDSPFTTLLGPTIHLSLHTELKELNGSLQFHLNTPTTQAELSGHLVKGALLLDQPFYAQFQVTKEASRLLLKEINPLDLSYIYSQAPVRIHMPDPGFYLPIYPWVPHQMTIPDASIELGKVTCQNEGNVNIALGLLKSKQFNKDQDLTLWFAPLDLSIKQGIVDLERTEILISDTFDICTWGKIDLVKEYVDMTLGLTAQTLSAAFGIRGLPETYVLTIPMKGKMDNVQINSSKATAKVALLLAWQNRDLAGAVGGPFGAMAGELLGAIATLPDANAKIPAAKHPFPWEIGSDQKPSSRSKKKMFKTSDKPLKQILKVIR